MITYFDLAKFLIRIAHAQKKMRRKTFLEVLLLVSAIMFWTFFQAYTVNQPRLWHLILSTAAVSTDFRTSSLLLIRLDYYYSYLRLVWTPRHNKLFVCQTWINCFQIHIYKFLNYVYKINGKKLSTKMDYN